MYLYAKYPCEAKHQFLIYIPEITCLKHFGDSKAFINTQMLWIIFINKLKNRTQIRKCKILIVLVDMIDDMLNNKKLNPIVTEIFIRVRKLNIFLVFIIQSYSSVPKNVRLKSKHCFIMKIQNKQQTSTNCISSLIRY